MTPGLQAIAFLLQRHRERPRSPLPAVVINRSIPSSSEMHQVSTAIGPCLVMFSEECALQIMAGVYWHDTADHCRTWTDGGGCACDSEGVDCGVIREPVQPFAVVVDIRLGPNGPELRGPPRAATPAELEQLTRSPPGVPVVLPTAPVPAHPAPVPERVDHDPKTCPTCLSHAAHQVFGNPSDPPKGVA